MVDLSFEEQEQLLFKEHPKLFTHRDRNDLDRYNQKLVSPTSKAYFKRKTGNKILPNYKNAIEYYYYEFYKSKEEQEKLKNKKEKEIIEKEQKQQERKERSIKKKEEHEKLNKSRVNKNYISPKKIGEDNKLISDYLFYTKILKFLNDEIKNELQYQSKTKNIDNEIYLKELINRKKIFKNRIESYKKTFNSDIDYIKLTNNDCLIH
jgi:hypothetical protein